MPKTVTKITATTLDDFLRKKYPGKAVFSRPPPDHPIYSLIGQVAAGWADLEHELDRVIFRLTGLTAKRGTCLTAQFMGVWPRLNAIKALLIQRADRSKRVAALIKNCNKLIESFHSLSEERNRIVHDPWYADSVSGKTARAVGMPRSDLIYGIRDHDKKEINKTLKRIADATEAVAHLRRQIDFVLHSSRGRRRQAHP